LAYSTLLLIDSASPSPRYRPPPRATRPDSTLAAITDCCSSTTLAPVDPSPPPDAVPVQASSFSTTATFDSVAVALDRNRPPPSPPAHSATLPAIHTRVKSRLDSSAYTPAPQALAAPVTVVEENELSLSTTLPSPVTASAPPRTSMSSTSSSTASVLPVTKRPVPVSAPPPT